MTDRELLEKAAKAAKLRVGPYPSAGGSLWDESDPSNHKLWNPLEDDGDALRLAVSCGLAVIPYPIYTQPKHSVIAKVYRDSAAVYRDEEKRVEQIEIYGDDPADATRRAIVKAAAALADSSHLPSTEP